MIINILCHIHLYFILVMLGYKTLNKDFFFFESTFKLYVQNLQGSVMDMF